MLLIFEKVLSKINHYVSIVACAACIAMLVNVFYDAIARYFLAPIFPFPVSSIGMQELEWHFFSVSFMFGMVYALRTDSHVRVDVFYEKFSEKQKAWVDLLGTLFFIIPFFILVAYFGFVFAHQSFSYGEKSGDPGGLSYRFLIKSTISLTSVFIVLASIENCIKALRKLNFMALKEKVVNK